MKRLIIDIETSPNEAHVWSLWNVNVGLPQLLKSSKMLCFGAKWHGEKPVMFFKGKDMVQAAWDLLDEADALIHFNGNKFDVPILRQEMMLAGMKPPSPFKNIDLCAAVKRQFRLPSNKLEYVSRALGMPGKTQHTGHKLWVDVLNDDPKAWKLMEKYCKNDVVMLEPIHDRLLPWLPNYPNQLLYSDEFGDACVRCEADTLQRRGYTYLTTGKYQRYVCTTCGSWSRGTKRVGTTGMLGAA